MLIKDAVEYLLAEKAHRVSSRFPCRAIMVKNIQQYLELLNALKAIPDIEMVSSSTLYSSNDVMPRYSRLENLAQSGKWYILTGVSEYLLLFRKHETESKRFSQLWKHMLASDNLGRIIIPLWGCESQWFDNALYLCDERQKEFYYDCIDHENDEDAQHLDITVLSDAFEQYIKEFSAETGHISIGLQEWHDYWSNPIAEKTKYLLLTGRCGNIHPVSGRISISVINDALSFVRQNLSGADHLSPDNCPNETANLLLPYAFKGISLDKAILSALNMSEFSATDLISKWKSLSIAQKQISSLWFQLHRDDSYLCCCMKTTESIDSLCDHILHDIFKYYLDYSSWISEWRELVSQGNIVKDDIFFELIEEIPDNNQKLQFLSCVDKRERVYLLRMVGLWLKEDPTSVYSNEQIPSIYPALAAYISLNSYDSEAGQYFTRYKQYKLSNTLPEDETLYFGGFQPEQYQMRYSILHNQLNDNCVVLWVDAMGAEWLPLLKWSLQHCNNGVVQESFIAQANIPSETCYNDQWNQMTVSYNKINKLDKLAHKGVIDDPDYYSCIEEQLSIFTDVQSRVETLLTKYQRVIVTGDHGSSRLAARFFHIRNGIDAPKKAAEIGGYGRFCKTPCKIENIPCIRHQNAENGEYYEVFSDYSHFTRSGFAAGADDDKPIYGEIHGGASPEEVLVPVVIVDSTLSFPTTADWESSNSVKIKQKKAISKLVFSKPVNVLEVSIGDLEAQCSPDSDKRVWTVTFSGVKAAPQPYRVNVLADGKIIQVPDLLIKSALGDEDDDL